MSLKNFNPDETLFNIEGNVTNPSLADIVTVYIDKAVFYSHACNSYIRQRNAFINANQEQKFSLLSCDSDCVYAEYSLLLAYLATIIHVPVSQSADEHQKFFDELFLKLFRLVNSEYPRTSPFFTPNTVEIINSHLKFYQESSFNAEGAFDLQQLIENVTPVFLYDLKTNKFSTIDDTVSIHDFSETTETFLLLFKAFSNHFDKLYEIINSGDDDFTASVKKSSDCFITVGQYIDSGLYRLKPISSTKAQIIVRYPKKSTDSYTEKVFTHKSIIWLRKGYKIKLLNCSLHKLIYA